MRRHVFWATLLIYLATSAGYLPSIDDEIVIRVSRSILDSHSFAIQPLALFPDFAVGRGQDGKMYASKGLGLSLVALPTYALGQVTAPVVREAYLPQDVPDTAGQMSRFLTSFLNVIVGALTAALLFAVALRLGFNRRASLVVTVLYAFSTLAWVYAVRSYFPEPLMALVLLASLYGLCRYRQAYRQRWLAAAGLALGLGALVKVTVILAAPWLLVYFLMVRNRVLPRPAAWRSTIALLGPVLLGIAAIAVYDYSRFGAILETGYGLEGGHDGVLPVFDRLWTAIYGLCLSSGKGLIVYALPLVFVPLAVRRFGRRKSAELVYFVGVGLMFLLSSAAWYDWGGGWSWGPRLMLPVIPLAVLPLGELLVSRWQRWLVGIAGVVGAAIQVPGVLINWGWWYSEVMRVGPPEFRAHPEPAVFFDPAWWPVTGHLRLLSAQPPDLLWVRVGQYFPGSPAWLPAVGLILLLAGVGIGIRGMLKVRELERGQMA